MRPELCVFRRESAIFGPQSSESPMGSAPILSAPWRARRRLRPAPRSAARARASRASWRPPAWARPQPGSSTPTTARGVRSDSDDAPMPPSDGPLILFHPVLQHPRQPPLHLLHPLHPGVGRRRRRGRLPRALPLGAPKRLRRVRLQVADLVEDGVERGCDL